MDGDDILKAIKEYQDEQIAKMMPSIITFRMFVNLLHNVTHITDYNEYIKYLKNDKSISIKKKE